MDKGIKLFKVFGIQISLNYSWFIIFGLIAWSLAQGYFPQMRPDLSLTTYWLMGLITALLLFLSVLLHELSHSYVALASGIEIKGITLFIFGGLARISREPSDARTEFKIAIAGPAASLALALVFWLSSRGVDFLMPGSVISSIFYYLFLINGILVAFNLIPGFPMDGGRILRAAVWKITGNLRKATRVASVTGQAIAFLMILFGIWQILRGFFFNGMWIALIGWFIHSAAARGYQQVLMKDMLKDLRAKDLMNRDFETVSSDLSVQNLVEDYVLKRRERAFLVSDAGKLRGIVCLEDIKGVAPDLRDSTKVKDIMTPEAKLEMASPEDNGNEVLSKLSSRNIRQLPVVEEGKVQGILCRGDVLRFLHLRSELGV